jgi:glutamyl-tRNA synthetase
MIVARLDVGSRGAAEALRGALIDGLGLKPRVAFGPVRTAVSGRRVSPPLFESMQILGKVDSLARIDRLAELIG